MGMSYKRKPVAGQWISGEKMRKVKKKKHGYDGLRLRYLTLFLVLNAWSPDCGDILKAVESL